LARLKAKTAHVQDSLTIEAQERQSVAQFEKHPGPSETLLTRVCRDNSECLDLAQDPLVLRAPLDRLSAPPAVRAGGFPGHAQAQILPRPEKRDRFRTDRDRLTIPRVASGSRVASPDRKSAKAA
jgi:hypothetical protein